ncbi:MAG: hypothetical protein U5J64_09180 [Halobacteriales archaeon]|nr:hypothetical protein [Halobacteriales archaeon]
MAKTEEAEKPLEKLRDEMRLTFESQVERLREIDNKAIEILKANLLLIGIFVTGISILVQTGVEFGSFINVFTVFAGLLLLLSTALAGVTYTSSNIRGGVDTQALEKTLDAEYTDEEFAEALASSYGRWIEYNAGVIAVNDILVTVTVLLVIDALVYLVAGIVAGVFVPPLAVSVVGFVVLTVFVVLVTRLIYNMDHIETPGSEEPTFRGARVSKGATRSQGMVALRQMLSSKEERDRDEQTDDV